MTDPREPYFESGDVTLYHGDATAVAASLPAGSVQTIVTSPPYYGLRDYGEAEQIGAESTLSDYVDNLVILFRELHRVLADDGTVWLNLGDSYSGRANAGPAYSGNHQGFAKGSQVPPRKRTTGDASYKNLLGVPWRVAFALQDDGWILRTDIVWAKPNPMPESVTDRPTRSHEFMFLFAKSTSYFYDAEAIAETASGQSSGNGFARDEQISKGGIGQDATWEGRPQLRRAIELAKQHGLTEEHFAAIRAVGMSDAGKAKTIQAGSGRNTEESQRLADEAKEALGGYYREFLTGGTRNRRDVWTVPSQPFAAAHFAVYPPELIRPCIRAGSRPGDTVLDPFSGSGTTGAVATFEGRKYIGIDLNRDYLDLSLRTRFQQPTLAWETT